MFRQILGKVIENLIVIIHLFTFMVNKTFTNLATHLKIFSKNLDPKIERLQTCDLLIL